MKLALKKAVKEVITPAIFHVIPSPIMAVTKLFQTFLNSYRIHFLSWILFISSEIGIIGLATGLFGNFETYFFHYLQNIVFFYLCGKMVYPFIFGRGLQWLWRLPLAGGVVIAVYLLSSYLIDYYVLGERTWFGLHKVGFNRRYIFTQLWRGLFFMGFAGFYYLFLEHMREVESRKEAEKANLQGQISERELQIQLVNARNSYLKAQINPHLLFNTLSMIYQDILETSPKSADNIMDLSDLMRYSINTENKGEKIELGEEIEQVKKLISLQRSRFDGEIFVKLSVDRMAKKTRFIPLVLLTLTENIFKHGIFQDRTFPATLNVMIKDGCIQISSRNLVKKKKAENSLNTGLQNIRQRLSLIYGDASSFGYRILEGIFELEITAPIQPAPKDRNDK